MNGVNFWLERNPGDLSHLEIETAYLPNVGDFIEIRGEEFLVVKRLWSSEVVIKKATTDEFSSPNGYGVKIILRAQLGSI